MLCYQVAGVLERQRGGAVQRSAVGSWKYKSATPGSCGARAMEPTWGPASGLPVCLSSRLLHPTSRPLLPHLFAPHRACRCASRWARVTWRAAWRCWRGATAAPSRARPGASWRSSCRSCWRRYRCVCIGGWCACVKVGGWVGGVGWCMLHLHRMHTSKRLPRVLRPALLKPSHQHICLHIHKHSHLRTPTQQQ